MKKHYDSKENSKQLLQVDELLLNVLGSEFFKSRQIPIDFIPTTPKKPNSK